VLVDLAGDPGLVPAKHMVPVALRTAPFTAEEAVLEGVTRAQLRGSAYRRLGAGLYRWVGLEDSPHVKLTAVARRLPAGAAFSGWTATWLHGLDVRPCDPIEVTIPEPIGSNRLAGAWVRRNALAAAEIVLRSGLPTTSALRTVVDLGARDPLTEGVVAVDLALHAGLVTVTQLREYVAEHPGGKGMGQLRRVIDLAEPKAESAMETRLRMILLLAGLPRPEAQVSIHDDRGRFLGRPDLLYRAERLAIEYDGENHRHRLVDDNRRQNRLVSSGLMMLRFTASDVYETPSAIAMQVRLWLGSRHSGTNGRLRRTRSPNSGTNGGLTLRA
jgi:very-short-patch-repair endonuclease